MKRILSFILLLCLLCGCSAQEAPVHEHTPGAMATCTAPQRCSGCEEILHPALGHSPAVEVCDAGIVCTVCGVSLSGPVAHTPGAAATCTEPQRCTVCGKTLAEPIAHEADSAPTCTEDALCIHCGAVAAPAAHTPDAEANCTDDQQCLQCGEILQGYLGHVAENGACSRCGIQMVLPEDAEDEAWLPETVTGVHYNNNIEAYYSGNVLVCGDYTLEYFKLKAENAPKWAEAVNSFANRFPELNVSALLIPKSCSYNAPAGFENTADNQAAYIASTYSLLNENVTAVDAMSLMTEHSGEYLYYRTDHHWTSLGAYYASYAYCRANGILPRRLSSYETIVNTGYLGSMYYFCKVRPACLKENLDYTVHHLPLAEYSMVYSNGGSFRSGPAMDTTSVVYSNAFLCGDNALSVITTNNSTGRNLLMFKDSFGNAFAPYMIDYYDTIVVVDVRTTPDSIQALVDTYGITDALIINNIHAATSLEKDLAKALAA